jgi:hypothetical protein
MISMDYPAGGGRGERDGGRKKLRGWRRSDAMSTGTLVSAGKENVNGMKIRRGRQAAGINAANSRKAMQNGTIGLGPAAGISFEYTRIHFSEISARRVII